MAMRIIQMGTKSKGIFGPIMCLTEARSDAQHCFGTGYYKCAGYHRYSTIGKAGKKSSRMNRLGIDAHTLISNTIRLLPQVAIMHGLPVAYAFLDMA